jgi:hypothetical protein
MDGRTAYGCPTPSCDAGLVKVGRARLQMFRCLLREQKEAVQAGGTRSA